MFPITRVRSEPEHQDGESGHRGCWAVISGADCTNFIGTESEDKEGFFVLLSFTVTARSEHRSICHVQ